MTHVTASVTLTAFRGRNDDGSQTAATWIEALNTDWYQPWDENFRLRFVVAETAGGDAKNPDVHFQYNLNGGGWNDVTTSSSVLRAFASSNYAEGDDTTQQIGSGTFVSPNSGMTEDGEALTSATINTSEIEVEGCFQVRSADVSQDDTIEIRATIDAAAPAGTPTLPTITVGADKARTGTAVSTIGAPTQTAIGNIKSSITGTASSTIGVTAAQDQVNTYYFDASTSGTGINLTNATDGKTNTDATLASGELLLLFDGTNAPSTGDQITQVRARYYGSLGSSLNRRGIELLQDGTSVDLGELPAASGGWGDFVTLSEPKGGWTWAILASSLRCRFTYPVQVGSSTIAKVDIEVTSNADANLPVYYFDASDSGPTDTNNYFSSDANAFDGSIATDATEDSFENDFTWSAGLQAQGTNAPASGNAIESVRLRAWGQNDSGGLLAVNALDVSLLGSITLLTGEEFTDWLTLSAPSGGWTWAKVQSLTSALSLTGFPTPAHDGFISYIEIEVNAPHPAAGDGISQFAEGTVYISTGNITSINTVTKANIAKINEILKANISTVNDIDL